MIRKPTHDEIAHVAFHLFLERGGVPGHEEQDWARAQQILIEKLNEPEPLPTKPFFDWEVGITTGGRTASFDSGSSFETTSDVKASPEARTDSSPFRPSSSQAHAAKPLTRRTNVKAGVED